ncbi:MAG: hypothetical protein F6K42_18570 [Leptolyngbya sp. SIO1D8]|nr:hypothetical protein [Leptolyngbya sp. SIO1D8]
MALNLEDIDQEQFYVLVGLITLNLMVFMMFISNLQADAALSPWCNFF